MKNTLDVSAHCLSPDVFTRLLPYRCSLNSADNVCFSLNCVFEIATGKDLYRLNRVAVYSLIVHNVPVCSAGEGPLKATKEGSTSAVTQEGLLQKRMNCVFIFHFYI